MGGTYRGEWVSEMRGTCRGEGVSEMGALTVVGG